jgi:hypothetical protein
MANSPEKNAYERARRAPIRAEINGRERARRDAMRDEINARERERRAPVRDDINARERTRRAADPEQKHAAYNRQWWAANPSYMREWTDNNPERKAFLNHRFRANQYGIPFLLTFEEWLAIWEASGKWSRRGIGKYRYCMARYGDRGAYAVGNVRITTNRQNRAEQVIRHRTKAL